MSLRNSFHSLAKSVLKSTVLRPGTEATILAGPLKGCKYVVGPETGWAPLWGGWEAEATSVYTKLISPGAVVFDIGSNSGIHTLLFSKLATSTGKVFAFEPIAENNRLARRLFELNNVHNVEIVDVAISAQPGHVVFKVGSHPTQGSLVGIGMETGAEVTVRAESIDNLIATGAPPPSFVKIDIEGAESDALAGYTRMIDRSIPTFAIDLHTPEQDVLVGKFFLEKGYNLYRINESQKKQALLTKIERMDLGWPHENGVWGTIVAAHQSKISPLDALV